MFPVIVVGILLLGLVLFRRFSQPVKSKRVFTDYFKASPIAKDFKYDEGGALKPRPFVGKRNFNPSMGVRNISNQRDQFLLVEDTYLHATTLRKNNIRTHENKILHCNSGLRAENAVREFYTIAMKFMTERYPQYFKITEKGTINNLINNDSFPLSGNDQEGRHLLRILAGNLEEDVIILLKDNPADENEEYIVRASLTGSPAGFDPSRNFDKPISFVHEPVPQYESRLQSPMHRFFNKVEPKDLWQRANWSIQTNDVLFKLEDHHGRKGDEIHELRMDEIDFQNACFMRTERQLITRLPESRAVIFLVRTQLTPVKDIKAEGNGEELAKAIESLPQDLAFYKRRDLWGSAVCQWLRS